MHLKCGLQWLFNKETIPNGSILDWTRRPHKSEEDLLGQISLKSKIGRLDNQKHPE
jgi:hypothetical protein